MELVKQGKQTVKAAGVKLKVSYRQARRIYAAYLKCGDAGLIHGNVGKEAYHKIKAETRASVLLLRSNDSALLVKQDAA